MSDNPVRVLVVEDDRIIAMDLAHLVEQCGCTVIGPYSRLKEGLQAAEQAEMEAAVLDIDLDSEPVWPIAEALQQRGVPFLLASGYSYSDAPEQFWRVPLLSKPVTYESLRRAFRDSGIIRE